MSIEMEDVVVNRLWPPVKRGPVLPAVYVTVKGRSDEGKLNPNNKLLQALQLFDPSFRNVGTHVRQVPTHNALPEFVLLRSRPVGPGSSGSVAEFPDVDGRLFPSVVSMLDVCIGAGFETTLQSALFEPGTRRR